MINKGDADPDSWQETYETESDSSDGWFRWILVLADQEGSIRKISGNTEDPELHGTIAGQSPEAENHVVLNTTVSLRVYSCASRQISKELEIEIPVQTPEVKTFRVTLQATGSSFEIEAVSYVLSEENKRNFKVLLNPPDGRDYTYTVYFDNTQGDRHGLETLNDAQ